MSLYECEYCKGCSNQAKMRWMGKTITQCLCDMPNPSRCILRKEVRHVGHTEPKRT